MVVKNEERIGSKEGGGAAFQSWESNDLRCNVRGNNMPNGKNAECA